MGAGRSSRPDDPGRAVRGGEHDDDDGPSAYGAPPFDDVAAPDGWDADDAHAQVVRDPPFRTRRPSGVRLACGLSDEVGVPDPQIQRTIGSRACFSVPGPGLTWTAVFRPGRSHELGRFAVCSG